MALPATSTGRPERAQATSRSRGLRRAVLWLPDDSDPGYRARMAEECRRLSSFGEDECAVAAGFAELAGRTEGWA